MNSTRTCLSPSCDESIEGAHPLRKFCSVKCRNYFHYEAPHPQPKQDRVIGRPPRWATTATTRVCTKCEIEKPHSEFNRAWRTASGLDSTCRTCAAEYRDANREHRREVDRAQKLRAAYGITVDDWNRMHHEQHGKCAICARHMLIPFVDHDHATGKVRALLCFGCNTSLGHMQDNPELLESAAAYLRAHSASA